jgi:peroxiredoxin
VGDPSGEVLRAYRVRIPVIGVALRVTYVVGRDRRIESAFQSTFDVLAHVEGACRLVRGAPRPPAPD